MGQRVGHNVVGSHHRWLALVVLLVGAVVAPLGTTIVNVAIPTIQTSMMALRL